MELTPEHAELLRRQRFTDAMLETIEVGIVGCDADGVFVVSNRAERALFGFADSLDGLRPEHLEASIDVFQPDGRRLAPADYPLMRTLRGEDVSSVDVVAGPAGGPYREIVVRGRQITDPDGEVLGAVAALTDVTAERAAQQELADERLRLLEAQRIGQLGSFEHDFRTGSWVLSEHLRALWGLAAGGTVQDTVALIHEQDRQFALDQWRASADSGGQHVWEFRIRRGSDGAERRLRCTVEVLLGPDGLPDLGHGTHQDTTDLHRAEQESRRAQAFFQAVLAATPDDIVVTDVASGAVIYSSSATDVLGLRADELMTLGPAGLSGRTHPEDLPGLHDLDASAAALEDGAVVSAEHRGLHADGRWRWVSRRVTPFRRDEAGRVVEVLAVVRDVTDTVEAQRRLRHAARHDDLTGLPNRRQLVERLDAALSRSGHHGRELAVLFCDLDGFKRVNDTAGHAAGDAVLVETARRLLAAVRVEDLVARVGGDEFVLVVEPHDAGPGEVPAQASYGRIGPERALAVQAAERVAAALRLPFVVAGTCHTVTASIGVTYARVVAGRDTTTAEELLRSADRAMYAAKSAGKDRFVVAGPSATRPAEADAGRATRPEAEPSTGQR